VGFSVRLREFLTIDRSSAEDGPDIRGRRALLRCARADKKGRLAQIVEAKGIVRLLNM